MFSVLSQGSENEKMIFSFIADKNNTELVRFPFDNKIFVYLGLGSHIFNRKHYHTGKI